MRRNIKSQVTVFLVSIMMLVQFISPVSWANPPENQGFLGYSEEVATKTKTANYTIGISELLERVDATVSNFEELAEAVNSATNEEKTILITKDFSFDQEITINEDKNLVFITDNDDSAVTLTLSRRRHFVIGSSAVVSLEMRGVILDGAGTGGGIQIKSGAELTLKDGTIQNCYDSSYGGGVHNAGTFIMQGGAIKGNTVGNSNSYAFGGGVYSSGTFIMENGTINGNTASTTSTEARGAGVYNTGTFTMYDGTISGNILNSSGNSHGAGVYNGQRTAFTMHDGTISGNDANSTNSTALGGGIHSTSASELIMYGGTISGNTAEGSGGGISHSSNFTMYDGLIEKNITTGCGGGVFAGGNFIMKDGQISENEAYYSGAGVHVHARCYFTMDGGTITGNTATKSKYDIKGGGVYNSGYFIMNDGTISNNVATAEEKSAYGGGIYNAGYTVTINDGTISGNTAFSENGKSHGGGIYNLGTVSIQDGIIDGNTARDAGGGIYTSKYPMLTVMEDVVFSNNKASRAYTIKEADIATHNTYVKTKQFSFGLPYGYNNFDINYTGNLLSNLYTVVFNADGGEPVPADQTVASGAKAKEPADPEKAGYIFAGWYLGEDKWDFDEDVVLSDMTLVAHWTEIPLFTVVFETDGGEPIPADQTVASGTKAKEPVDPEKIGYIFAGWYLGEDKWDFEEDVVLSDMTLVAHWTEVPLLTVVFDTDGGEPVPADQKLASGSKVRKPADPEKTGYSFAGWYLGESKWDFEEDVVLLDMTLVARWTEVPLLTVVFDTDGGEPVPADQKLASESKVRKPADPEKTGYSFAGWYLGESKWDFEGDVVLSDMTLVAHWTEKGPGTTDPGTTDPGTNPGNNGNSGGSSGGRDRDRSVQVGRDIYINDLDIPLANELLSIFDEEVPLAEADLFDIPDTGIKNSIACVIAGGALFFAVIAYRRED